MDAVRSVSPQFVYGDEADLGFFHLLGILAGNAPNSSFGGFLLLALLRTGIFRCSRRMWVT
jgi:hypothetical protein